MYDQTLKPGGFKVAPRSCPRSHDSFRFASVLSFGFRLPCARADHCLTVPTARDILPQQTRPAPARTTRELGRSLSTMAERRGARAIFITLPPAPFLNFNTGIWAFSLPGAPALQVVTCISLPYIPCKRRLGTQCLIVATHGACRRGGPCARSEERATPFLRPPEAAGRFGGGRCPSARRRTGRRTGGVLAVL